MSSQLFSDPPQGVIDVFSTVCSISKEHWKTLGLIAIFKLLSMLAAVLILSLVTFLAAASYIFKILEAINRLSGGGYDGISRSLLDYSVGLHGASRLLDGDGKNFQDIDDDFANLFTAETFSILLAIYVLWVAVLTLVSSLYLGSFYHALGNIYSGGFPSVRESISRGTVHMWSVYFFSILYSLLMTGLFLLMVGLPFSSLKMGVLSFGIMFFIVTVVLFGSLMAGATPSIVVERKSAMQAFGRSLDLCRSFVCFIFCTQFSYVLAVLVLSVLFNMIFNHLPGVLGFIGHMVVNIMSSAIMPVFNFVIYMSLRIRKENATQADLAMEIGNNEVVNAIEIQGGGMKNDEVMTEMV